MPRTPEDLTLAETAILNQNIRWDAEIQDSIGPDYGWEMLRRSQLATSEPAFGTRDYRTIGNKGHSTTFTWINRSRDCVERLRQWAEQYEDGYFTMIDHDGRGRHYVGTFVGDIPSKSIGNDRYNIEGWQFDEIPGAPMLQYPDNWDKWAVSLYPFKDNGSPRVAINQGAWIRPAAVVGEDGVSRQPNQLSNIATPTNNDAITFEYRGYGFRIWAPIGPAYNQIIVTVDGVSMGSQTIGAVADEGTQVVYTKTDLPLDIHRVKIVLPNSGQGMILDHFEVMR
jgi:hypothetical protein